MSVHAGVVVAFLVALLLGSLVEYWLHRGMHERRLLARTFLGRMHARHHAMNTGQGFLLEAADYLKVSALLGWMGFLVSLPVGISFLFGCVAYALVAAYAHQRQHEKKGWMRGIHEEHHRRPKANYGLTTPLWDYVFRTRS